MDKGITLKIEGKTIDINKLKAFDAHKKVIFVKDKKSGLRGFIAIHRSNNKHPSFGATRMWQYATNKDALKDVLRLSQLMSYKSALAGLNCGGAKGVIMFDPDSIHQKNEVLNCYATAVNDLEGSFVTGTDVGLFQSDIIKIQKQSPYFVGLKVNPTTYTAFGLLQAVKSALSLVYNSDKLSKRSFAIQGVGKVGSKLLDIIYSNSKDIYITDIDMRRLRILKAKYPRVKVVSPDEIHKLEVDVYSPCALSFSINHSTAKKIKAKIIVGGANNQLASEEAGEQIFNRGIIYVPDYVANAGGLISVVNEYYNKNIEPDMLIESVSKIGERTIKILKESIATTTPTHKIADNMAKRIIKNYEK